MENEMENGKYKDICMNEVYSLTTNVCYCFIATINKNYKQMDIKNMINRIKSTCGSVIYLNGLVCYRTDAMQK